jgi:hypothetical protein
MITATKAAQKPSSKYDARETWEIGYRNLLEQSSDQPETLTSQLVQQKLAYLYAYLEMEMAGGEKKTDWKMVQCVYERILAVLGDVGGKDGKVVESKIWEKYGAYMVSLVLVTRRNRFPLGQVILRWNLLGQCKRTIKSAKE